MLVFAMPEDVSRSSTAFPLYRAVTSGNSPGCVRIPVRQARFPVA
jgi:hypothetical protein